MADFIIPFLLCNIYISGAIILLLLAKRIFKKYLSCRMQYHLWTVLLGLLAVPFLPFRTKGFSHLFTWLQSLKASFAPDTETVIYGDPRNLMESSHWINDFTLSVNKCFPQSTGLILWGIWLFGVLVMLLLTAKTFLGLRALQRTALPLSFPNTLQLYHQCLQESRIKKYIPVYSVASLKSPITAGILKPRIYLPVSLILQVEQADHKADKKPGHTDTRPWESLRYILLHELQHCRHKDSFLNILMTLVLILYWLNPFVWYAIKAMKDDREMACDASVLNMLTEDSYAGYGNTLIDFARQLSPSPFPYVSGLFSGTKQIKKRIINIATYQKPTIGKRVQGIALFLLTASLLFHFVPLLSAYAKDPDNFQWNLKAETVSSIDLSSYFGEYEGSFVVYDSVHDVWYIHHMEHALSRVSPNSTYKIYDALFALEEGVISPGDSFMEWDGNPYPFETWNADQTLKSAMASSVNWYFQSLDRRLGEPVLQKYFHEIGYGNEDLQGGLSSYWQESSLKISPVEQVLLLTKLSRSELAFSPENMKAVNDSLYLFSSGDISIYGKTGTGQVNGQNVNGWFVGYVKASGNTCFFATNITDGQDASGSKAAQLTMSILNTDPILPFPY